jgi:protoporphyrinogen oxidase
VVLGAGVAGLRAAVEALERGYDAVLIEQAGQPGGMARSHRRGDFVYDHGPHGFFSDEEWVMQEFLELIANHGGYNWLTKWSQIHYRNEYFNFPLRIQDVASKLSPLTTVGAGLSFLWSRVKRRATGRDPANAEEYLVEQFGRVLYDAFFGPYTRKVWDMDPRDLDADFTRDRVPALNLWDVFKKLFVDPTKEGKRTGPSGRTVTHDLHRFYYPKSGAGALPAAYTEWVERIGGTFLFNARAQSVDLATKTITVEMDGETRELSYDGMVSTIPLDELVPLMSPAPPPEIRLLASGLRYRAIQLVNVSLDRPEVIGPFWIYFTDRFFNRISEYRHFSDELAPEGKTGICFEVACHVGDPLWNAADIDIVRWCMHDLEELGLAGLDEVDDYHVIREPNAYPIYEIGYKGRLRRLIGWIEGTAEIMTAGRQGRFLYCNQDAAIVSGREAAQAAIGLLETGIAPSRLVEEQGRPRRKVVR